MKLAEINRWSCRKQIIYVVAANSMNKRQSRELTEANKRITTWSAYMATKLNSLQVDLTKYGEFLCTKDNNKSFYVIDRLSSKILNGMSPRF